MSELAGEAGEAGGRTVVLGVGNPWRRDDGLGPAIVAWLRKRGELPAPVEVRTVRGEPLELLAAWEGADLAVVIDAASTGAPPGTLTRIDVVPGRDGHPLPARLGSASTHGLGLADAVELGRTLGRLPKKLVILAVEGEDFGWGSADRAKPGRDVGEVFRRVLRPFFR